jgi:HAE1 family hydrophobic/amphiphilic exporter-1/multidrug efflux pump
VDIAQVQTQNRQKLAEPQLPDEVIRQGITVKKMSPNLLSVVALNSTDPKHDPVFISNYALIQVLDNIKRIPGVGDAVVYGAQNYAMRLILDPVRMAQLNITPTEIANVVREQNRDFPAGRIGRDRKTNGIDNPGDHPRPHERGQGIRGHDYSRLSGRLHGAHARCGQR